MTDELSTTPEPLVVGDMVVLTEQAGHMAHVIGIVQAVEDQFGYVNLNLGSIQDRSFPRTAMRRLAPGREWYGNDWDTTIRPIIAVRELEALRKEYLVEVYSDSLGYKVSVSDDHCERHVTQNCDSLWAAVLDARNGMWPK